jgi:hypothetical protein
MHSRFSSPGREGLPFLPDRCEPAIDDQKDVILDSGKEKYNPVLGCERFIYMLVSIAVRQGNTKLT